MPGDKKHKWYLARAERAFQNGNILKKVKAIVGPNNMPAIEQSKLAEEALNRMKAGKKPTPKQLAALEFVIRLMRPAPLAKEGALPDLDKQVAPSFPDWPAFRTSIKPFLYSIGRIDIAPKDGIGTGFLVSDGILVTNKHVVDILSKGTGELEKGQAVVWFKVEADNTEDEKPTDITGVIAIHDELDIALLKVNKQKFTQTRQPLELDPKSADTGLPVVAIGYPFDDSKRNPLFIKALFGKGWGLKRAAPGEVSSTGANSIYHDCSTLGGNSGSPIVSMKTARVVGLHRDGYFLYRNEAVDAASLSQFMKEHL
jgi:S1-C subfamily serine protease